MTGSGSTNIFERPERRAQRRVVVTGLGAVTPLGLSAQETWAAVREGRSGIGPVTLFEPKDHEVTIAGEVKGFNPDNYIPKKEQKKMDRFIHLAMAASSMAIADAGLTEEQLRSPRVGAIIGVGIGGLPVIEQQHSILMERGPGRITPFFIPATITNLAAGQVSIRYGCQGPNYSVTSACASGNHSIGEASRYIREGLCDIMIAGGAESAICPLALGGFASMKALSTRNDRPEQASRPWDRDRDGFVLSEGCGILILEDYERAEKRGARIYGEVRGYGVSSDAYHMSSPSPGGAGAAEAMRLALNDAGVNPDQIDYINAHGTSTPVGDVLETQAIKVVFGAHARQLWVSSTKSMMGHTLGAAGAIESVLSLYTLSTNVAPPTINLDNPSDDCDLDYVPWIAREKPMRHVLNNSFGFGGTNACLILSKLS